MKKSIPILVMLLITTVSLSQTFTIDGITYEVTGTAPNTAAAIENSNSGAITIPALVTDNGIDYTVTSIGEDAFRSNSITSVVIPEGVVRIGDAAFFDNQIASVSIPGSVTTIERAAFRSNQLTDVLFAEGLVTIGETAFLGNQLSSISIPNSVTDIVRAAFQDNDLETITLGNGLQTIDDESFRNNDITEVTLPASITTIGRGAFRANLNLQKVVALGSTPAQIVTGDLVNDSFRDRSIINLTVPNGTEATYASAGWTGFLSVNGGVGERFTIDGITYEITGTNPNTVKTVDNTNTGDLVIPATVPFNGLDFSVTAIGDSAFRENGLTSVTIPRGVTSIGINAFFANLLTSVVIPNGVTSIGSQAFRRNDLTSVTIPSSVMSIGRSAFGDNDNLTDFTFEGAIPPVLVDAPFSNEKTILDNNRPSTSGTIGTALTVPAGAEAAYLATEYITDFVSVNGVFQIGGLLVIDDIKYKITGVSPFTVEIVRSSKSGALEIPATVTAGGQDFSVTAIGEFAFGGPLSGNPNNLTSVVIPNTVISIGIGAFVDNPNLASVTSNNPTPPTLGSLFAAAEVKTLTVPQGSEPSYLAAGWTGFITINDTPTVVGETFIDNNITYEITSLIPATVTALDNENIGGLTIPGTASAVEYTLTVIEEDAFRNNTLTNVIIPEGVTTIGTNAFRDNPNLASVTLPSSLTTIGDAAFIENAFTTITIPENVTSIGASAFRTIRELTTVISENPTPPALDGDNVFLNTASRKTLTIPAGSEAAYIEAGWTGFFAVNGLVTDDFIGDTFTENNITYRITGNTGVNTVDAIENTNTGVLELPEVVTSSNTDFTLTVIENAAFQNNQLTRVTIPGSVTTIKDDAFRSNQLRSVTFSEGLDVIGDASFFNNQLTSVAIPNSVTTIARAAFQSNEIETLSLGESVTTIGDDTFRGNNITEITLPAVITSVGRGAFSANVDLEKVTALGTIPAQIVTGDLVNDSFRDRSKISLTVPEGTETTYIEAGWTGFFAINGVVAEEFIGDTFTDGGITYRITGSVPNTVTAINNTNTGDLQILEVATTIDVDFNVTAIGDEAFRGDNLNSIVIPASVTSIGASAFRENNLTSVIIPNSVTTIGRAAFTNNDLESIVIPNSVTSLGDSAFLNNALTSAEISNSITTIEVDTFKNNNLTSVVIPQNINIIGGSAFRDNPDLAEVTSLNTTPPVLGNTNVFANTASPRTLRVPAGTTQAYIDAGWTGFDPVVEFDAIQIALKVFLQGASLNPNPGEEDLMRDDLLLDRLIPSTSPYRDEAISSVVLRDTIVVGPFNIVDWVFVQLRDANDRETVVAEQSALLQRDGDVVATDGFSALSFTVDTGDYFVAIEHRNHLGILSANPITLSATTTTIDFTADPSVTGGGENALVEIDEGVFAMVAGDFDENGQVQPSDVNAANALIGTSSYSNADMDMNGQIQPADVNNLINPNIGRGIQLLARSVLSDAKSDQKNIEFIYKPGIKISDQK